MGSSGFRHNPEEFARACECAALVLHCAVDRHARLEEGEAIYKNLTGSKELVIFEGAGNTFLYEADTERWKKAVKGFIGRVPAGAGAK